MKKVFYCFVIALLPLLMVGQVTTPEWQKAKIYQGMDEVNNIGTDKYGNFYFIADRSYHSYGGRKIGTAGNTSILGKMDPNGNTLWTMCTSGLDKPFLKIGGVAVDNNGDVIISGTFEDSLSFDSLRLYKATGNPSASDIFVAKFDSAGKILWLTGGGGNSSIASTGVSVDSHNNIYMSGICYLSNDFNFQGFKVPKIGLYYKNSVIFAKLSPSGKVLWLKNGGGNGSSITEDIATYTKTSDTYICGYYDSAVFRIGNQVDSNKTLFTNKVCFIAKVDSAGNCKWIRNLGFAAGEYKASLAIDSKGNVILTGTANIAGAKLNGILYKYDSQGNLLWQNTAIGGNDKDNSVDVAIDEMDNIYISGTLSSIELKLSADVIIKTNWPAKIPDLRSLPFIAKFDEAGKPIWAKSCWLNKYAEGFALMTNKKGSLIQFGVAQSDTITFDTMVRLSPPPHQIIFTAIINQCNVSTKIVQNGNKLEVPVVSTKYQWYFNGQIITGANTQSYTPAKPGQYKLTYKEAGGCMGVSDEYTFTKTGIAGYNDILTAEVYPNPANGKFTVKVPGKMEKILIYTTSGQLVKDEKINNQNEIEFELTQPGLYFVNIYTENTMITKRVIIL